MEQQQQPAAEQQQAHPPVNDMFESIIGERGMNPPPKYYKRKLIGSGTFGQAWLVERANDGAVLAAKATDLSVLSQRDRNYARSEIKCLAMCQHACVIQFVEDFEQDDVLLIIMEFADAGDLSKQVKGRATHSQYLEEHEVGYILVQLLLAIDHIHRQKMLHRDLKSANVLLTSTGLVKIGDFGFSNQYEESVSRTVADTFCGTPYYVAPELWNHKRYSKKADVWALGIILYEMLALRRPFVASNMKGLMEKILQGEYPPIPTRYSKEMQQIVDTILVPNPHDRPSAAQIGQIPYVAHILNQFELSLKQNSRVPETTKSLLLENIAEYRSGQPAPIVFNPQNSNEVLMEGTVQKESESAWKERFLQLTPSSLVIAAKKGDERTKSMPLTRVVSVVPVPHSATGGRELVFAINTVDGRVMWIQAETKEALMCWIESIQQVLQEHSPPTASS